MPISKLLPDGRVEIYSTTTGEVKQVAPEELKTYNPKLVGEYLQLKNATPSNPFTTYAAKPPAPAAPAASPAVNPAPSGNILSAATSAAPPIAPPPMPQAPAPRQQSAPAPVTPPTQPRENANLFGSIAHALVDPAAKYSRLITGGLLQAPGMALGLGNIKDAPIVKNTPLSGLIGLSEDELKKMDGKSAGQRIANTAGETARRIAGAEGTVLGGANLGGAALLPTIAAGAASGALQGASAGDNFDIGSVLAGGTGGAVGGGLGHAAGGVLNGLLPAITDNPLVNGVGGGTLKELAPYLLGAVGGGGVGAFKGRNLGSTAAGIGGGLAIASLLKNPQALAKVAGGLGTAATALPAIGSEMGTAAGIGSNQFLNNDQPTPPANSPNPVAPTEAPSQGSQSPVVAQAAAEEPTRTINPYGFSIKQLDQLKQSALNSGDIASATTLNDAILKEEEYQRKNSPKNKENTHATTASEDLDDIRQALGIDKQGRGSVNSKALFDAAAPGGSVLGTNLKALMTQYTQSQSASGRYTQEQVAANTEELTPRWWDSPDVVKNKLNRLEKALNNAKYLTPLSVANDSADAAAL